MLEWPSDGKASVFSTIVQQDIFNYVVLTQCSAQSHTFHSLNTPDSAHKGFANWLQSQISSIQAGKTQCRAVSPQNRSWTACVLILHKVFNMWLDPLHNVSSVCRCISLRTIYITSQTWRATHWGWRHRGKRVSCTMALLTGSMKVWKHTVLSYTTKYHRSPLIRISCLHSLVVYGNSVVKEYVLLIIVIEIMCIYITFSILSPNSQWFKIWKIKQSTLIKLSTII